MKIKYKSKLTCRKFLWDGSLSPKQDPNTYKNLNISEAQEQDCTE